MYYGALRVGATVVPMNPLLKSREIEHHLSDSGAQLALVWTTVAAEAASAAKTTGTEVVVIDDDTLAAAVDWPTATEVAARDDDDTAVILYTSGTTGTPKGPSSPTPICIATPSPSPSCSICANGRVEIHLEPYGYRWLRVKRPEDEPIV